MAPFYEQLCKDLKWKCDENLLKNMKVANETELKRLDVAIEDAEKNLGETEVREFMLKKAEYLCKIGDKVIFVIGHCKLQLLLLRSAEVNLAFMISFPTSFQP
jgi:energy-converting hydrogenase Eha subunit H